MPSKISLKEIKIKFPYHKRKYRDQKHVKTMKKQKHIKKRNMTAKGLSPKILPLKVSCSSDWSLAFLSPFLVPVAKIYQNKNQTVLDIRRGEIQL